MSVRGPGLDGAASRRPTLTTRSRALTPSASSPPHDVDNRETLLLQRVQQLSQGVNLLGAGVEVLCTDASTCSLRALYTLDARRQ